MNLIVVCGPTASGKTRLGVAIARSVKGEIISVDSRQVYRGLDIGTGKDRAEYDGPGGRVPSHLIDIADPRDIYTLWNYQQDFYRVFAEIQGRAVMPVAVGGSGLYLEAVLRNYPIPDVPEDAGLRASLMTLEKEALDSRLLALDPGLHARTDRTSKKRIVRAIEVALHAHGGNAAQPAPAPAPRIDPLVIAVRWPRPLLHERIRQRLAARIDGLIAEVKRLMEEGVSRQRLDLLGLEYRHGARYVLGQVSREAMFEELFAAIRRFAKRQETYFRGMERRGVVMRWIEGDDTAAALSIVNDARETG